LLFTFIDSVMAHSHNEALYLENAIGKPLVKAVAEVCEKRPADPIEYIASFLHKYREQSQPDDVKVGLSDLMC